MKRKPQGFRVRVQRKVVRAGVVVGIATVLVWVGSLVLVGACITGVSERFGRSPMKPPK